jgi:endoglucanase
MRWLKLGLLAAVLFTAMRPASAANLVVFDDASENGFDQNCSFGGVTADFDFANSAPTHTGAASIRFTPDAFNAVSWCAPAAYSTTADYPGITFWVFLGSSVQGANVDLVLSNGGVLAAAQSLETLNGGVPIAAGSWVQMQTTFAAAPLNYAGLFDQISLQDQSGVANDIVFSNGFDTTTPTQNLYFDDVVLQGAGVAHFRGTNVPGMEMAYATCLQANGPVADTDYPSHDTRLIDYFAGKNMTAIRYLFTWECMQPNLGGTIPGDVGGNYQTYFDNYKAMVDYATNTAGLQVIIEPWEGDAGGAIGAAYNGNLVGSVQVPISDFADFWSKIATLFKDNPKVSYGLINEPNHMSTATWFTAAQAAITAIRGAGSNQRIYVPGNAYTAASTWTTANSYGGDATSNADGWLNANGVGQPLADPLNNIAVEVHDYVDCYQGGLYDEIMSNTAAGDQADVTVQWARANGYSVYIGEIGLYAGNAPALNPDPGCNGHTGDAATAWANFITYADANTDTLIGFTWWAGGYPAWWNDLHAPHFSISPTSAGTFTGDTVNMTLIQGSF